MAVEDGSPISHSEVVSNLSSSGAFLPTEIESGDYVIGKLDELHAPKLVDSIEPDVCPENHLADSDAASLSTEPVDK